MINTDEEQCDLGDGAFQYSPADQWILSRLQRTIERCHHDLSMYRFDLLANTLYEFIWNEYCDWYVELSKSVLYDEKALGSMKRGTRRTLIYVLNQMLKLLHPIMPFITEEIWQRTTKLTSENTETIMLSRYPHVEEQFIEPVLEDEMEWLKKVVQSIRTIRSEMTISPAKRIPLNVKNATPEITARIQKYMTTLMSLSKLSHIHCMTPDEPVPLSASAVVGELELLIPMAGIIDKDAELMRLEKELMKLNKDVALAEGKLNNPTFTEKAPADIIGKEREKLAQAQLAREKLLHHQSTIEAL